METQKSGAEMETKFNPQAIENDIYQAWETSGAFTAHRVPGKKPFTIVMPPPNITGQLHMGHAMDCTLQDAAIRYHRMKGDPTLWLPGTDHAAIATEVKIVEAMAKEGPDQGRHGPGRLPGAGLGVEGRVRRPHCARSCSSMGVLLRLEPGALHHGRGLLPGGARSVRQAV